MTKRKRRNPGFKARLALEALKGEQTASEPASRNGELTVERDFVAVGPHQLPGRNGKR